MSGEEISTEIPVEQLTSADSNRIHIDVLSEVAEGIIALQAETETSSEVFRAYMALYVDHYTRIVTQIKADLNQRANGSSAVDPPR